MKFITTIAMILAMSAHGIHAAEPKPAALSGGFIQYWGSMENWKQDKWHPILDSMRALGMKTIIIQRLEAIDEHDRTISFIPNGEDATTIILNYAAKHGMQVYLGLQTPKKNGDPENADAVFLEKAAKADRLLAEKVAQKYGNFPAFTGWYIPMESWTSDRKTLMKFQPFFQSVSKRCKELAAKPVAFSPFINGTPAPAEMVQIAYEAFLPKSGIDLLMLQDGVGARNQDADGIAANAPYFDAVRKACQKSQVRFWANVESFTEINKAFFATTPERFRLQRQSQIPFQAEAVVTFDFFHYLNPVVTLDSWNEERTKQMKAMYDALLQEHQMAPNR